MSQLKVTIGERNGDGRQSVAYLVDGVEYPDLLNLQNGFEREKSVQRAIRHLGLQPTDIPGLAAELIRHACAGAQGNDTAEKFELVTCSEMMAAEYNVTFLVDNVFVAGQLGFLGGPMKVLKTSFLVDLALALVRAGHFLGRFNVPLAVNVLLMTAESGLAVIRETIQRVCRAAGYDPSIIHNLHVSDRVPWLPGGEDVHTLRKLILDNEIGCVLLDPTALMVSPDTQASHAAQAVQLRELMELATETGVGLLLAHHTQKATARLYEPLDFSHLTGAGYAELGRQFLMVSRRSEYMHGSGYHDLFLAVSGSVGHGGLWAVDVQEGTRQDEGGRRWHVEVEPLSDYRQAKKDQRQSDREAGKRQAADDDRQAVFELVRTTPGMTMSDYRDESPFGSVKFGRAWKALESNGDIVKAGKVEKANRQSYDTWKSGSEEDV